MHKANTHCEGCHVRLRGDQATHCDECTRKRQGDEARWNQERKRQEKKERREKYRAQEAMNERRKSPTYEPGRVHPVEEPRPEIITSEVEAKLWSYLNSIRQYNHREMTQGLSSHHVVFTDGSRCGEFQSGTYGQGLAYIYNALPALLMELKSLRGRVDELDLALRSVATCDQDERPLTGDEPFDWRRRSLNQENIARRAYTKSTDAAAVKPELTVLKALPARFSVFLEPLIGKLIAADMQFTDRCWREDFNDENGRYLNPCSTCGKEFIGNKHRRTCKICANPIDPHTPPA